VKQAIAPHVKDADTRVLLAAMDAAYYLHMRESREDLLANLDHQDASVRVSATQCLALMGFSEAAVPISKLLKDREPDVRKSAARELLSLCGTEHCDPAVGGALLEALPDKSLGPDIARTIAILPIPGGRQPVLSAFQADLAHDALWLVDFSEKDIKDLASFFGPEATRQILGQYLSKGPAPVRYRSALYLGGLHDPQSAPFLFEALHDTDKDVVAEAIRSSAKLTNEIGDKRTLERLRAIASLPDASLVETLQEQLPRFRDRAIFGITLAVLRNPVISTDRTCLLMPLMCTGRWDLQNHPNLLGRPDWIPGTLDMLTSKEPDFRAQIARVLAVAGVRQAVHPVSRLLKDPDPKVRATAGEALFWMCVDGLCDDTLVPSLLEARRTKWPGKAPHGLWRTWTNPKRYSLFYPRFNKMSLRTVWDWKDIGKQISKSLADFVSKDNLKALLELYLKNGPLAAQRKAGISGRNRK
jgi:HEAT repeat protein